MYCISGKGAARKRPPLEECREKVLTNVKIQSTKYHAPFFKSHKESATAKKKKSFKCLLISSYFYLLNISWHLAPLSPFKAAKRSSRLPEQS